LRPDADGTFSIRIGSGMPVFLSAWHPLLGFSTPLRVAGPQDDVVLHLRAGPETLVHLKLPPGGFKRARLGSRIVLLDKTGKPAFTTYPIRIGGTLRFGGYAPGTWTLWIDGGAFAPTILPDVRLGKETTELKNVAFSRGSSIEVEFLLPAGAKRPPVRLRAEALGEPGYVRSTIIGGNRTPILTGLGKGRFRFLVRALMQGARVLDDGEVEVEGNESTKVTIDMR